MIVSVLQWNVFNREDIRRIAEFLLANPIDVICLQELTIGDPYQSCEHSPNYIADQLGYNHRYVELHNERPDGTIGIIANAVFSRFPITGHAATMINERKSHGGYDDQYRGYVEVGLDLQGHQLVVGTTHMSYTDRFEETPDKQAETNRLIAAIADKTHGYVLAADLNATPHSYTVESLSRHLNHVGPDMFQSTWTTKPFYYNGFRAQTLDWRLDYIFASRDIGVEAARIITTDYSDHLPILASLNVDP